MNDICHRYERVVAFPDTDASGWVHFTKLLSYAEEAEHDFLRKSGIAVFTKDGGGWPRVKVTCDFKRPLGFHDSFEVCLAIAKLGESSVEWKFEIFKDSEVAASGTMITAKVDAKGRPEAITSAERKILEGGK